MKSKCKCCEGTGLIDVYVSSAVLHKGDAERENWELQLCEECEPVMYPIHGHSREEYLTYLLEKEASSYMKNCR